MPKSNTEKQAEYRAKMRGLGFVYYQNWVTPEQKRIFDEILKLEGKSSKRTGKDQN